MVLARQGRASDGRAALKKAVDPVMAEYAKEIGADAIYAKINAM